MTVPEQEQGDSKLLQLSNSPSWQILQNAVAPKEIDRKSSTYNTTSSMLAFFFFFSSLLFSSLSFSVSSVYVLWEFFFSNFLGALNNRKEVGDEFTCLPLCLRFIPSIGLYQHALFTTTIGSLWLPSLPSITKLSVLSSARPHSSVYFEITELISSQMLKCWYSGVRILTSSKWG